MLSLRRLGLAALVLVLAAAPTRAAEVDKHLPDDTEVVLSVNVKQLLETPLFQKHCLTLVRNYAKEKPEVQAVLDSLGFDPLRDVSRVTVAGSAVDNTDKFFAVVRGRFDAAKLHAKADEVARTHADHLKVHAAGGQRIYEVRGATAEDRPLFVGLIDGTTLVAASAKEPVADAFARTAGQKGAGLGKEVCELIAKADDGLSAWLVAPGVPLAKSPLAGDEQSRKSVERITALTATVHVQDVVRAEIALSTKTPEDAKALTAELADGLNQAKGLLQVLAGNQAKLSPLVTLIGGIKAESAGPVATLKTEVTVELLEKLLKQE